MKSDQGYMGLAQRGVRTHGHDAPRTWGGGPLRIAAAIAFLTVFTPGVAGAQRAPIDPPPHGALHQSASLASFGAESGLENKTTFTVDFEADGTTWLASSDGLYRYDGYRWKRFGIEHGLPTNYIRCATVTATGRLWVGCRVRK